MTVVDFRSSGGFDGSQPQRPAHEYPYGVDQQADDQDAWPDQAWGDAGYQSDAESLGPAPSMLGRLSRLTHYLGALISVGLIVILAVWGYKLVVRDVSGVPLIRAIQGEARTAPDDPGGELSDRTGLAVNTVAAGKKPTAVDSVVIAPTVTGLADQDKPMGDFGATAQQPATPADQPLNDANPRVIARPDGEPAPVDNSAEAAVASAVISDAPMGEGPVNEAVSDTAGNAPLDTAISQALAEAGAEAAVAAPTPAVEQSARPAPRPRRVAAATAAATPEAAPAAEVPVVDNRPEAAPVADEPAAATDDPTPAPAASVSSGSSLVQIGAFDSDKLARGEWNRVSGKFGGLFAGKGMVVQEHKSNGRSFWRLRASGFASKDEARRFCAALIAGGVDCIPATAK